MIVTRRRRKPFPWKRVVAPLFVIAVIAGAFVWPVSRDWLVEGPLSPVFRAVQPAVATFNPQNAKTVALQKQLAADNTQIDGLNKQVSSLQTQLTASQQNAAAPAPTPTSAPPARVQSSGSDLSTQATPDMRRTASVWAAMDPEAAAKVVQRLPDYYVARIFAIMSPDAAGAILENLPPSDAARLTQDRPELQH